MASRSQKVDFVGSADRNTSYHFMVVKNGPFVTLLCPSLSSAQSLLLQSSNSRKMRTLCSKQRTYLCNMQDLVLSSPVPLGSELLQPFTQPTSARDVSVETIANPTFLLFECQRTEFTLVFAGIRQTRCLTFCFSETPE